MANTPFLITRGPLQLPTAKASTAIRCPCVPCGASSALPAAILRGQLLTEEDLNRLDYYIQRKTGSTTATARGASRAVSKSYAGLRPDQRHGSSSQAMRSPVRKRHRGVPTESVDICDLINRCRPPATRLRPGCSRPPPASVSPAATASRLWRSTQDWVLAICYAETRPWRCALRANACDCGCGCSDCSRVLAPAVKPRSSHAQGCACKSSTARAKRTNPPQTRAMSRTVRADGTARHRFVVYKAPRS